MRPILIAAAAVVTLLAADGANAQESFFNKRYCLIPSSKGSIPDCSYNTWAQCRASVSGGGQYCSENTYWKPEAPTKKARRPDRS
jgi:hypothetical protein